MDAIERRLKGSGLPGLFDLSALANNKGWSARAEVGVTVAPNVTVYAGGAAGNDWARPGVEWQAGAGLRVRF